jgi:2-oxo-4-hydroxy-4-carboxy-5-ureidoimidazoline decarboxylase
VTLEQFNAADAAEAGAALLQCCGSKRWTEAMLVTRPFRDRGVLFSHAESIWRTLEPGDWLEAFSAHPRIGEKKLAAWSSQEQNGLHSAPAQVLEQLAAGNREYERRFGWIFLVQAAGKSAQALLDSLQARLTNPPEEELRIAAGEQAKITALRLDKLFDV